MSSRVVGAASRLGVRGREQVLAAAASLTTYLRCGHFAWMPSKFFSSGVGDEQRPRAAVLELVLVVRRREQRVQRHRHDAGLDRAEEQRHPVRRVEHRDGDALLALDAEPAQRVGGAVDALGELRVGAAARVVDVGDLVAAAGGEVALDQVDGGVVLGMIAAHDLVDHRARRERRVRRRRSRRASSRSARSARTPRAASARSRTQALINPLLRQARARPAARRRRRARGGQAA